MHKDKRGRGSRKPAAKRDGDLPHPVLTPLTMTQAARLACLAEEAVAERGQPMRYDGSSALVPIGSDGRPVQDGTFAGLVNLARTVAELPRQRWRSAVAAHFDQITAVGGPPRLPDDLENELYLRLVNSSTIDASLAERVTEFVPGVLTAPATYAGRAVAMHFDIGSLGMSWDEITRIGLANLRRLKDDVEQLQYRGAEVAALSGSMFTASRALVLNTVLRESLRIENPAFGCLVAMPVRDLLLVHVLRDPTAAIALDLLVKIAASAYGAQAGPVSPHVYHVEGNTWQQVTDHSTGVARVLTTGRLDDAMDRLGVDAGDRMSRWA